MITLNSGFLSVTKPFTDFMQAQCTRYSVYLPTTDTFLAAQAEIKNKAHAACKTTTAFIKNHQLACVALGSLAAGITLHSLLRQPISIPCDVDMKKVCEAPVTTALNSKVAELVNLKTTKESLFQELASTKALYTSTLAKINELERVLKEKDSRVKELLSDKNVCVEAIESVNAKLVSADKKSEKHLFNSCYLASWVTQVTKQKTDLDIIIPYRNNYCQNHFPVKDDPNVQIALIEPASQGKRFSAWPSNWFKV